MKIISKILYLFFSPIGLYATIKYRMKDKDKTFKIFSESVDKYELEIIRKNSIACTLITISIYFGILFVIYFFLTN